MSVAPYVRQSGIAPERYRERTDASAAQEATEQPGVRPPRSAAREWTHTTVDDDAARQQLDRVLRSPSFRAADRSSALLRYVVEQSIAGRGDGLKEYTLGGVVFGRAGGFDQRTDSIVRAEASRLRSRLVRDYATDHGLDSRLIDGSRIRWHDAARLDVAATRGRRILPELRLVDGRQSHRRTAAGGAS